MKNWKAAAAAIALSSVPVSAGAVTLTNGVGDGKVTVGVLGAGAFGAAVNGASDALYNPAGATAQGATTYKSYLYLGFGGARTNISTLASTITASTATSVTSNFAASGLSFVLLQNLADQLTNGVPTGSLLTQAYSITNTTAGSLTFDLVRYLDGDLGFNGGNGGNDGGGRLVTNGTGILFETDTAIGSAQSDTFVGISNEGGTSTGFQSLAYAGLRTNIANGVALANTIQGDSADADQFIDMGAGYDVTLGLGRSFTLGAGQSTTFTTRTIFGTGAPGDVVVPGGVPEPATWGLMLAGFGMVGASLRSRRRATVRFA